ncbi:MAG: hypothetical protein KAS32_31595 [Candidatus Peribacteraceae bacterium]|nr:hypothetical protein [Candidatus Peribacteraceae bacterium]
MAVRKPKTRIDGKLWEFTLKIGGERHRCECGCNVFHKPDETKSYLYKCNCCPYEFETSED